MERTRLSKLAFHYSPTGFRDQGRSKHRWKDYLQTLMVCAGPKANLSHLWILSSVLLRIEARVLPILYMCTNYRMICSWKYEDMSRTNVCINVVLWCNVWGMNVRWGRMRGKPGISIPIVSFCPKHIWLNHKSLPSAWIMKVYVLLIVICPSDEDDKLAGPLSWVCGQKWSLS